LSDSFQTPGWDIRGPAALIQGVASKSATTPREKISRIFPDPPGEWEEEGFKILEKYGRRVRRTGSVSLHEGPARRAVERPRGVGGATEVTILIDANTNFS